MHRSGTSALSAAVEMLGFNLGKNKTKDSSSENKKGFFENSEIIKLNDDLLSALGARWDNPIFEDLDVFSYNSNVIENFKDKAIELVLSEFSGSDKILIKDPRCCLLIPFWESVFNDLGFNKEYISYIHIFRDAYEVAESQKIRSINNDFYSFGTRYEETISLWLSYIHSSLLNTKHSRNLYFNYKDVLDKPNDVFELIAEFLGVEVDDSLRKIYSERFVDKTLYRSIANNESTLNFKSNYPKISEIIEITNEIGLNSSINIEVLIKKIEESKDEKITLERIYFSNLLNEHISIKLTNKEKQLVLEEKCKSLADEVSRLNEEINLPTKIKIKRKINFKIKEYTSKSASVYFNLIKKTRPSYIKMVTKYPSLKKILYPILIINYKFKRILYSRVKNFSNISPLINNADFYTIDDNSDFSPKVSIIVPNYNHGKYLTERLNSIYNQTYKNYEVILMDDMSTDNSLEILRDFANKYSNKTKLIANNENSGGVFNQWKKGLEHSSGELVWIAESDDYCSNNFLQELVDAFRNESVLIAFSNTLFVKSGITTWSLAEYLSDVSTIDWTKDFLRTSRNMMLEQGFGIKNIIPNVSSAVFKNPKDNNLLNDINWRNLKVCGDWAFYSEISKGGCIAYKSKATNFYRQHENNTSVSSHKMELFYKEHHIVAKYNVENYGLSEYIIDKQLEVLGAHLENCNAPISHQRLIELYKPDELKLLAKAQKKRPHILQAGYAFSAGGGETFPIQMANIFKANGYTVTFLNCNEEPSNLGVRKLLRQDIPIVNNLLDLNSIVKELGIDIIQSHHAWVDSNIMQILDPTLECQHIVTMHGMYEMMGETRQVELIRSLHDSSARLVYTADKNFLPLQKSGLGDSPKIVKMSNALDIYPIHDISRKDMDIPETAKLLCMVARSIPDKGWKEAIESVKKARENSSYDIHLLLIGEGEESEKLKKISPEYIHFLGFKSNIRDYFHISDFGLLPTKFKGESFPLVIIDCFHSMTPIISTNVGEIKNMMDTEIGLAGEIVELDNWALSTDKLSAAIICALNNEKAFYLKRVKLASDKFSPKKLFNNYNELYSSVLKEYKNG